MSQTSSHLATHPAPRLAGPLYLQIQDLMRQRIHANEWASGHYLPNEGDLARAYGVSIGTMRKALELLGQEKLIVRRQGLGTYVNAKPEERELSVQLQIRSSSIVQPQPREAADLQIGAGKAMRLEVLCLESTVARSADTYLIPLSAMPEPGHAMGCEFEASVLATRVSALDRRVHHCIDKITITRVPENLAKIPGIALGTPVLNVSRLAFDPKEQPLFLCERVLNPDAGAYVSVMR